VWITDSPMIGAFSTLVGMSAVESDMPALASNATRSVSPASS